MAFNIIPNDPSEINQENPNLDPRYFLFQHVLFIDEELIEHEHQVVKLACDIPSLGQKFVAFKLKDYYFDIELYKAVNSSLKSNNLKLDDPDIGNLVFCLWFYKKDLNHLRKQRFPTNHIAKDHAYVELMNHYTKDKSFPEEKRAFTDLLESLQEDSQIISKVYIEYKNGKIPTSLPIHSEITIKAVTQALICFRDKKLTPMTNQLSRFDIYKKSEPYTSAEKFLYTPLKFSKSTFQEFYLLINLLLSRETSKSKKGKSVSLNLIADMLLNLNWIDTPQLKEGFKERDSGIGTLQAFLVKKLSAKLD